MDLLTQTLSFSVIQPNRAQENIFAFVIDGRLTFLAQMLQSFKPDDVTRIVNSKDTDGKTPLFYACYYNFQNIVMYLLMKDADPYIVNSARMNCFHICAYRGHFECAIILIQYQKHKMNMALMEELKALMKAYNFKKTDASHGLLICSDKHIRSVQQRFLTFTQEIQELFQRFLDELLGNYRKSVLTSDQLNRTPAHYAALSKYTKSLKTMRFIMLFSLRMDGWDFFLTMFNEVQLLELQKEKKIDPRQYHIASESNKCLLFSYTSGLKLP